MTLSPLQHILGNYITLVSGLVPFTGKSIFGQNLAMWLAFSANRFITIVTSTEAYRIYELPNCHYPPYFFHL